MALIAMNYNSSTIRMHQNLTIVLPEDITFFDDSTIAKQLQSMLLLHGSSGDETTYIRYTSTERYTSEHQLMTMMPSVDHSGYVDMVYGHSYYDYILEIYEYVHQILPLSRNREDSFIAGHSIGGYGTIKFALARSNKFVKATPLSAVFRTQRFIDLDWINFSPQSVTGNNTQIKGTELDICYLLDQAINANVDISELFIMCGKGDFLYHGNLQFIETLNKKGISYKFEDGPGDYDYAYWDRAIRRAIEWLVQ